MTFINYAIQHRELLYRELHSELTQSEPILFPKLSHSKIERIEEDDNQRSSVGLMTVTNQGKISSLNGRFVSMWKLPKSIVTARCERQAWRFIAKQLLDPYNFLVNIRNIKEQRTLEIQEIVKLKNGKSYSHTMQPQWLEKTVVARTHKFSSLL